MARSLVVLIVVLALGLAGCEGLFVRGKASEHGVESFKVGVPL